MTTKKLPFANGDYLEYETDRGEGQIKTKAKILLISELTNTVFVLDEQNFRFTFAITDVLDRINDGLFTVKVAS